MKRLEDKVAIITGATGGIGRAAVELFIKEGANVVMVDLNEDALIEVSNKINSNKLSYFQGDVSILADNKRAVELAIERHGGLDVFIANAGVAGDVQPITEYDEETFDKVMAVNAKGPFLGLKAAIPHMSERGGGSFVVTSSVAGVTGASLLSPYVMSKHAVVGLIKSAAKECADMNIRVNSVNPSPVETNMMRVLEDGMNDTNEEDNPKTQIEQTIPLKRYAEPIEIANLLLFLSGDESEFITGSVHMIDGGFTA
jgi:NAD(P)-dependent dehydrogenase (short-subunit alcohol dehydrogenase family)|tara:strand:- start:1757 stop:2524 length:768 start_codon:yes stop_codon:yes gene_type:complete